MDDQTNVGRSPSRLEKALSLLDPPSRRVVSLWLEGKTDGEVAASLGLPERIVAALRARALACLRDSIALEAPPESPLESPLEGRDAPAEPAG
jgi:DNA-directed RNA polymerase specialized sigma24 family protein